jgi:uncharacterized protein with von Willebrand factor type A (vWA) domain
MKDPTLRSRYRFIDKLPDRLFDAVVCNPHGALRDRSDSIVTLRDSLLSGELPSLESLAWPKPALRELALQVLTRSGLAEVCAGDPDLTDAVLLDLVDAAADAQRRADELAAQWILQAREQRQHVRWVGLTPEPGGARRGQTVFDDAAWERLRADADEFVAEFTAEQLFGQAELRKRDAIDRKAVRDLFSRIGKAVGIGREAALNGLTITDPKQFAAMRRLLSSYGPFVELLRSLGRFVATEVDNPADQESPGGPIERAGSAAASKSSRGVADVRGVERSADISRMLSSEAALRAHPATRKLWLARFVERSLLTYFAEASVPRTIPALQYYAPGVQRTHTRAELGPIIIILDTSASMRGADEIVAKAAAMQAVALAQMQRRPCYLYNFAGVGEIAEQALSFENDGLARTIALLSTTFGGGTVIDEPLRRAARRVASEQWRCADLLVLTDGGVYGLDGATLTTVEEARKRLGFRVHTGLTGTRAAEIVDDSLGSDAWAVRSFSDQLHGLLGAAERGEA